MTLPIEEIARGLTEAMEEALDRLSKAMVWIDGRSRNALVRRGLAQIHGNVDDALLGSFVLVTITPLGLALRTHLQSRQP